MGIMEKIQNEMISEVNNESCFVTLSKMADNSIDSIVTDPPYELGFMGKHWDSTGIAYNVELWRECLRVLKPGGHLLAFGGSRTYHRMACAIEDAGFEVRDMIEWIYGSGFPKSLDISKMMDKMAGVEREVVGTKDLKRGSSIADQTTENSITGWNKPDYPSIVNITIPTTPLAKQWNGWGTALKPSHEPICMARKPIDGTVAQNVIKWGCGGLNIDGCRIRTEEQITNHSRGSESAISKGIYGDSSAQATHQTNGQSLGRFPANLIHDGSEEVRAMFPDQKSGAMKKPYTYTNTGNSLGKPTGETRANHDSSSGSASRFFQACEFTEEDIPAFVYCAKASRSERDEGLGNLESRELKTHGNVNADLSGKNNNTTGQKPAIVKNFHPTCKPVALMRYLCRLVTPPNGTVYDPFTGSGTTGIAAKLEGFNFIGSEMEAEYAAIARARIEAWQPEEKENDNQLELSLWTD